MSVFRIRDLHATALAERHSRPYAPVRRSELNE